ncbi:hypothetical protein P4H08_18990 [Bacillus cereus]|nr:hypothetical protein [Bacillus cereus]
MISAISEKNKQRKKLLERVTHFEPFNNEQGLLISLSDVLDHRYGNYFTSIEQPQLCSIWHSGDGWRAYLWLEAYLDVIQNEKFMPKFVDILCYTDYEEELLEMYKHHNTISNDEELLNVLEREHKIQSNAMYLLEILKEIKTVLKSKNIPFRQITWNDIKQNKDGFNNGENEVKIFDPKGDYPNFLQKLGLVANLKRKP